MSNDTVFVAIFNPTHHKEFTHLNDRDYMGVGQVLMSMAVNPQFSDLPLYDAMNAQYPYGMHEMTPCEVDPQGVMSFPGDPDLYPLIAMERGDEVLYIYQHEIVAFVNPVAKTSYVTRMD